MPILDTTTCAMACLAALADSPNLLPFSSITGIPYFNSLIRKKKNRIIYQIYCFCQNKTAFSDSCTTLPLSHEGNIDAVCSSNSGKRDKPTNNWREALQQRITGIDVTSQLCSSFSEYDILPWPETSVPGR